jgi:ribosomal protein L11 methyltransferase
LAESVTFYVIPAVSPPLWKVSVTLAKAEAADVAAVLELTPPAPQAVLLEEEPFGKSATVEALYVQMPDGELLAELTGHEVRVAQLPDINWIKLSQEGLPPVRAGRFFVYGAHDAGRVPQGVIPIRIEAGMAFGTGHHETTSLCLLLLSDLAKRRRFSRALDLGTGTGVLAIAAAKLWRRAVLASDIDPVAVAVARENAILNEVGPLIRPVVADGVANPKLAAGTPFDLVIANILAAPLTRLAPQIAASIAPGGLVVLSGLLASQENLVSSFYRPHGLIFRRRLRDGPWSALLLESGRRPG